MVQFTNYAFSASKLYLFFSNNITIITHPLPLKLCPSPPNPFTPKQEPHSKINTAKLNTTGVFVGKPTKVCCHRPGC